MDQGTVSIAWKIDRGGAGRTTLGDGGCGSDWYALAAPQEEFECEGGGVR